MDVAFTGSNLCGISLSTSVTGIEFSNISYDGIMGETASATIHLGSNTPYGTAIITLRASGGSTTFDFEVINIPDGPPVVDTVSPAVLEHDPNSQTLTLTGNNLYGARFEVSALPAESDGSVRSLPTVSLHSQDPAGTWLALNVDASGDSTIGFHLLKVSNGTGADALKIFRIVPQGPWVDLLTPSKPAPGPTYVLTLVGGHLQGAELTAEDTSRLRIHSVDNSVDGHLQGFLEVLANAANGPTNLIVRDSQNRETRVPGVYRSFCNFPLRGNFSGYRGLG